MYCAGADLKTSGSVLINERFIEILSPLNSVFSSKLVKIAFITSNNSSREK